MGGGNFSFVTVTKNADQSDDVGMGARTAISCGEFARIACNSE